MAVVGPPYPASALRDDHVMDTRTPSPVHRAVTASPAASTGTDPGNGTPDYKPDLSAEVAMLSTKLVNAINYQTHLDDSLQQSRHELEQQRQRSAELEAEKQQYHHQIASGVLVEKAETDQIIAALRAELATERAAREAAEKAKKQTEGELENLTGALFEEANNMVANARKETEAMERKNIQLKSQLYDHEMLMTSQQEQLQDLKSTIERLQNEHPPLNPSAPSTPVAAAAASTASFDALQISPNATIMPDVPPEHPLHFSHLIAPVLRNDTSAFTDFQDLFMLARRLGAHSRQNSNHVSQTSSVGQTNPSTSATSASASSSSPNLPGTFSLSGNSSPSSASVVNVPPLKESKFYKRVLVEDIEPTLRLDLAPGLSFLSRRTVVASLLQGGLAVEPYPQNKNYFPCTLCGESRRSEQYMRRYRFRTSEDDNVSKPLCDYCLTRLRATCDFVGFLRMIRDGYWKCDSEDDQRSGWEESVRLRERMFWARVGGGVVPRLQMRTTPPTPSSATGVKSARHSLESIPERPALSQSTPAVGESGDAVAEKDMLQSEQQQKPSRSSSDDAIVSAPAHVAVTATLAVQPTPAQDQAETTSFHHPPTRSSQLDNVGEGDAESPETEPTTPLESASQHLQIPLPGAHFANTNITEESDDDLTPVTPMEHPEPIPMEESMPSPRVSLQAAAPIDGEEPAVLRGSRPASSLLQHLEKSTPRSSLSSERASHERKGASSVLARVRAMEQASADSSKSLPGAFD